MPEAAWIAVAWKPRNSAAAHAPASAAPSANSSRARRAASHAVASALATPSALAKPTASIPSSWGIVQSTRYPKLVTPSARGPSALKFGP